MSTLLEQAKAIKLKGITNKRSKIMPVDEELQLVLGYLRQEISIGQLNRVVNFPDGMRGYVFAVKKIQRALANGKIEIVVK